MNGGPAKPSLSRDHALELLGRMVRIRRFEAKCAELHSAGKIRAALDRHDGEEAVAAGVISALGPDDRIVTTYRAHAHALMRGIPMAAVMAEMYGKAEGCTGGRGGVSHLYSREHHFHGATDKPDGGLPLAAGLALGDKLRGADGITVCLFGSGVTATESFNDSLRMAAAWKLPVLLVCEENRYDAGSAPGLFGAGTAIAQRAAAHGVEAETVDGMDVAAVEAATRNAVMRVVTTGRPRLVVCQTDRDTTPAAKPDAKDPIVRLQASLMEAGLIRAEDIEQIERAADREIAAAIAFAEAGSSEPVETLSRFAVAAQRPPAPAVLPPGETIRTTYREALRAALAEALERIPEAFVMGEGAGRHAVSSGLVERFGPERVRDTPFADAVVAGAGIGAAVAGARSIVEVMAAGSPMLALAPVLGTAATLRHMSNGQFGVPLVMRVATGGSRLPGLEGWIAHVPGLRILAPATLEDARGMLWTALQDPDPVLIFENGRLLDRAGEIAANAGAVDIDKAAVRRPGRDVSLITHGGALFKALQAADELAQDGIEAEVIDLRVLRPLDTSTILDSVSRTRRALIIDDGWPSGSLAAEIGMRIAEDAFYELDAPLARLCSAEAPIPYARHLEEAAAPQAASIVARVRTMFGRA